MSHMLRKQIYIDRKQERLLKRKASELGVSESELIRDGIEKILLTGTAFPKDITAWEREKIFIHSLMKQGAVKGGRSGSVRKFMTGSRRLEKIATHSFTLSSSAPQKTS